MPTVYRDPAKRARMLTGIAAGEQAGLDRTGMVIVIWTVACVYEWISQNPIQGSPLRKQANRVVENATRRKAPTTEISAATQARALYTQGWMRSVAALTTLGFVQSSGYRDHSLSFLRLFEDALLTEALKVTTPAGIRAAKKNRGDGYLDAVFALSERIRAKLVYLRSEGIDTHSEARDMFKLMSSVAFDYGVRGRWDRPSDWTKPKL